MYRAPSKRRQLVQRVLVYGAMTITVALLVTILVFIMLGYRFNRATSTIEQGGLVQFASRPTGADVTIGSAKLANRTPSKITVNPGDYTVTMAKKGYHQWSKPVEVLAGQILWLNYAQLVPEKIDTTQIMSLATIADADLSPNGDRYGLVENAEKPELAFVDLNGDKPKRTVLALPSSALPTASATTKTTYSISTWMNDSDRLIVKAQTGNSLQWLFVDRRDADKTVNLSRTYVNDIVEAVPDPRSNDRVVVRTKSGDVRIIDTRANSLSAVVASSVTSMSMYGDDAILVVRKLSATTQSVGYVSFGSTKFRELKEIDSSATTKVAGSTYFSDPYIAIASGSQLDVYKVRSLPSSESDSSISMTSQLSTSLPAAPQFLSIKTGGRFVLAQLSSGLLTYDLELSKQTLTSFKTPVTGELRWLDRYHFYLTTGTKLEVMEFDGANAHEITSLTTRFDATQRDDGKYIYSLTKKTDGTYVLQRSQMILE